VPSPSEYHADSSCGLSCDFSRDSVASCCDRLPLDWHWYSTSRQRVATKRAEKVTRCPGHGEYRAIRSPVATAGPIPSASEQQQEDDNNQDHFHRSLLFTGDHSERYSEARRYKIRLTRHPCSILTRAEPNRSEISDRLTDENLRAAESIPPVKGDPAAFFRVHGHGSRLCGDRRYEQKAKRARDPQVKRSWKPRDTG